MKKNFLTTGFSLIIILLLIGVGLTPTALKTLNIATTDSCDIATWCVGDKWIYTADPVSYFSENGSFDGKIENLKREVIGVTTITHGNDQFEVYQVDITGDITGEITWEELSGDLDGIIEGFSYIRISDLAEVETEIVSTGIVKILFINRDYELTNTNLFFPPLELFDFPIKLYDQWEISSNNLVSGSFILEDFIEEEFSESGWLNETIQCTSYESLSVPAGDFDSYKIIYSSDTYWYSPEVGNLVKTEIDQSDKDYSFNMDLTLESFSRFTQSIDVTENINPSEALIDQEIVISGRAVDSNSDPIQNGDISIEIPRISEQWFTITDDGGYYTKTIEAPYISDDTPSEGEFGSDGVIVRCSFGYLEGYRVKTLLIIDDFPPGSPIINGPSSGKKGVEYDYEFYASDPDGDDLYYFVEWGDDTNSDWNGPYQVGQSMILSHTWNEEGTFTIRAKAKDYYDSESNWAELTIIISKNKAINTPFFYILQSHPNLILILTFLLQRFVL